MEKPLLKKSSMSMQQGFTLIELMVAIVLGLLLVAAAIQLFTGGIVTTRLQQANAELQDSGIFGLDYIIRDIRLANYGNIPNPAINDKTSWGGVVLTARTSADSTVNLPATLTNATTYFDASSISGSGLLTHSVGTDPVETVSTTANAWKGLSNVSWTGAGGATGTASDQLTIQFVAPTAMTNCEGANVQAGDLVIERFFLRVDANGASNSDYALACDANTPTAAGTAPVPQPGIITGLGDAGQIIMPRVDHFHILLGARDASNNLAYYTVNQYRKAAQTARTSTPAVNPPRILSIKIAVLVRSNDNTNSSAVNPGSSFIMLDQTVTPADTATRYARRVYTTTAALRNAMGEI